MGYSFFYDESKHSRRLTKDTLAADDFAENFVVSIVGYSESICSDVKNDYLAFEEKHKKTFTIVGEFQIQNISYTMLSHLHFWLVCGMP